MSGAGVPNEALEAKIDALGQAVHTGFDRIHGDIAEMRTDVKALTHEGLPRRVEALEIDMKAVAEAGLERRTKKLEDWRDSINARWWGLAVGLILAAAGAWLAVLAQ